jgi:predicted nucleic acid-binding protein
VPFVLDASTSLAWCFEDMTTQESELALDRLTEDSALVPALWELEVANALLTGQRRGRLTEFQAVRFLSLLRKLPITVDLMTSDVSALLAAGRRHDLSAYDAASVVPAEREGLSWPRSVIASRPRRGQRGCGSFPLTPDGSATRPGERHVRDTAG